MRALKKSPVRKHSIAINGSQTSISVEDEFWHRFRNLAQQRGLSIYQLLEQIDRTRTTRNLSSTVRVFCLKSLEGLDR
jgi:predicted DNA-binding ribbon-helix-helix protein